MQQQPLPNTAHDASASRQNCGNLSSQMIQIAPIRPTVGGVATALLAERALAEAKVIKAFADRIGIPFEELHPVVRGYQDSPELRGEFKLLAAKWGAWGG